MSTFRNIVIVSGGQTGADRAALDFALAHNIPHGGWCPQGRRAEDGPIPQRYRLCETPSRDYSQRTEWNVRDSDATVLFTINQRMRGGTALTRDLADRLGRLWLHLVGHPANSASDATALPDIVTVQGAANRLLKFIAENRIARLNVAGSRASQEPALTDFVNQVLETALVMGRA